MMDNYSREHAPHHLVLAIPVYRVSYRLTLCQFRTSVNAFPPTPPPLEV